MKEFEPLQTKPNERIRERFDALCAVFKAEAMNTPGAAAAASLVVAQEIADLREELKELLKPVKV